jgi:hypothetical protein
MTAENTFTGRGRSASPRRVLLWEELKDGSTWGTSDDPVVPLCVIRLTTLLASSCCERCEPPLQVRGLATARRLMHPPSTKESFFVWAVYFTSVSCA